jgi:peptide/nickel transport system substrate-binding protein
VKLRRVGSSARSLTLSRREALAALGVIALGACGDGDSSESATDATSVTGSETTDAQNAASTTAAADTTAAPSSPTGTLRIGTSSTPPGLDPHFTNGNAHVVYLRPIYDTLLRMDASGELAPGLVAAWEWENDTTLTLDLRTDVTFTDGTPFDSTAVRANVLRVRDDERSVVTQFDTVADVDASDPAIARITFTTPSPFVLDAMARRSGMIASPTAFESGDLNASPVGSGPWIYSPSESEAGVSWVYALNESYWDPASQGVERLELTAIPDAFARQNALQSGQLDLAVIEAVTAEAVESSGLVLTRAPGQYAAIIMQALTPEASEVLADREVRRALAASIDREAIVESVLFGLGTPSSAPVAPDAWFADESIESFAYDPDAARPVLDAAGDVSLRVPAIPTLQTLTTAVGGYFEQVGATLEQITVDPTAPRLEGGTTALLATFPLEVPSEIASAFYVAGSPLNPYGYTNPDLDALVAQARATFDRDELAGVYRRILDVLAGDALLITIATVDSIAAHPDSVTGVEFVFADNAPNPLGIRVDG